jgi:hypothetical protein
MRKVRQIYGNPISGIGSSKMGELTSKHGDASTARKYGAIVSGRPLTGPEIHWLEEAVKVVIRRLGEFNSIRTLSTIELTDLPAL